MAGEGNPGGQDPEGTEMGSPEATLGLKSSSGRCGQEWSKEGWERRAVGLGGGQALQEPGCPAE